MRIAISLAADSRLREENSDFAMNKLKRVINTCEIGEDLKEGGGGGEGTVFNIYLDPTPVSLFIYSGIKRFSVATLNRVLVE